MWDAEHSMAEVHSQLCLVVPFLCGVDCMKPEGNVTNSCLLLPLCHQSNRGLHTHVITYPVHYFELFPIPSGIPERQKRCDI